MTPPKMKTTATIRAAMPATSRPYSTAEAPSSLRRLVMVRKNSSMRMFPSLWNPVVVSMWADPDGPACKEVWQNRTERDISHSVRTT